MRRQFLIAFAQFARGVERGEAVILDESAALAVVIVQFTLRCCVEQAAEVIKTVAVVPADGGVELETMRMGSLRLARPSVDGIAY